MTCLASKPVASPGKLRPEFVYVEDEFNWLEKADDVKALAWVRTQNERMLAALTSDSRYPRYLQTARAHVLDDQRIAGINPSFAEIHNGWIYNHWQDATHPRGIWRRTPLPSYLAAAPDWDVLLDIDALAKEEGKDWILMPGLRCAGPTSTRCLIFLAEKDWLGQQSLREFDIERRAFVPEGFQMHGRRGFTVVWKDEDTLYVAADFGPGTLSRGGQPLAIEEWRRGTSFGSGREIFRGNPDDYVVQVSQEEADPSVIAVTTVSFVPEHVDRKWLLRSNGHLARMMLPDYVGSAFLYCGQYVFQVLRDWTIGGRTWRAGSLLSIPFREITDPDPTILILTEPGYRETSNAARATEAGILVSGTINLKGRLWRFTLDNDQWSRQQVMLPDHGTIEIVIEDAHSKTAFVKYENFLQPTSLYAVDVPSSRATLVRAVPARFDSSQLTTELLEATSKDGTRVPYFMTKPRDLVYDGQAPTLMYGYGRSGWAQSPSYSGTLGKLWLEPGGVYVVACVRGGGELGDEWHVRRAERRRTYEDFIAIAEDLIRRKITRPRHLGIRGFSAGGHLMGVMMTQRPDLFGAAIVEVGNLDNLRRDLSGYPPDMHVSEDGSLNVPEERAFLESTSPFHNLRARPDMPVPLIMTSRTDTVVPPAQSRRFAAKMERLGLPFFYYETTEGGHTIHATPEDEARIQALRFTYLAQRLVDKRRTPQRP